MTRTKKSFIRRRKRKTVEDLKNTIDKFDRLLPNIPEIDLSEEYPEEAEQERQAQKEFAADDASFAAYKRKIDQMRAEIKGLRQR